MKRIAPVLLILALLLSAGNVAAARNLEAFGKAPVVLVQRGDKSSGYLSLEAGALELPLAGPGKITGFAKLMLSGGTATEGRIRLDGVPGLPPEQSWSFKASTKDVLVGRSEAVSVGKKIAWNVPAGRFTLRIEGDAGILLRLRYEGPSQPFPQPKRAAVKKLMKEWTFKRKLALGVKYDNNIVHYSDDLMDEFTGGPYLAWYMNPSEDAEIEFGKFRLKTLDDIILTPSIDLEARHGFFSLGETRFRGKFTFSRYLNNPIKDVKSLALYIRQMLPGSGQSLELSYKYTPEKYIRELTDRDPYSPSDDPRPWVGFRFTSNDIVTNYRHKLTRKLSMTITVEDIHRFYNLPFLEQDLVENEIIGRLDYSLPWKLKLTGIYGTARGWTRRYDTAEETPLNSDDNDNSYTQDRYRADLRWTPRSNKFYFDSFTLRYQLRQAWFTSPKVLWDDPFHVGRQDVYNTYRLIMGKRLSKKLGSSFAIDYTTRTLNSPYTGDISEGMDYGNFQAWMNLTYNW